jgi:hypothetical protein
MHTGKMASVQSSVQHFQRNRYIRTTPSWTVHVCCEQPVWEAADDLYGAAICAVEFGKGPAVTIAALCFFDTF